ncbi:MAG TPA: helix-turn-helix domain-containing GNAT family N-acetyltransferase [Gemmatimonadaceae bacterium]|nr:helix-turn-helix domain-containing GNAT family N-acetyltransferase [Gemmatimonadaceae bacterium]
MPAPSAASSAASSAAPSAAQVAAVRRFNRIYTARAGLLTDGHLGSAFALAEVRILFELAHRRGVTATELCRELGLDKGYVSRVLRGFARRGYVRRGASSSDARRMPLTLTARGRAAFAPLERAANARVRDLLATIPAPTRARLVADMSGIAAAMAAARGAVTLRRPRPGDLGWVVQRHGALYAAEYGYDERFEALVAKIVAGFVETRDPARERCWIAEQDGAPVGSVFLVRSSGTVARLRLLLVEPSARGAGVGRRLVRACTTFARRAGYSAIELWTQEELAAARTIYAAEGYTLVSSAPHAMFGPPSIAETWRLELRNVVTPAGAPSGTPA